MAARIALCHEWVTTYGGSEQCAARIANTLDVAAVYTFAAEREMVRRLFGDRPVHASRIGSSPLGVKRWQWLLPLMPRWWRNIDLSSYDAVVTSSHAAVNSVRAPEGAVHISYCYTPMRYAWDWRAERTRLPAPLRPAWPALAAALRRGDRRRSRNVDLFIADSKNVADRIARYYGRRALVVYPPVDTSFFRPDESVAREDFLLFAGRLVSYKRADLAITAASRLGRRLVVAGSGPAKEELAALAGPTVEFVDGPTHEELRGLYRRARAFVAPGVEDFGMMVIEAQACGTPVVSPAAGGALETVRDGVTGRLYRPNSVDGLVAGLAALERDQFDRDAIRRHAEQFGTERFDNEIACIVDRLVATSSAERSSVIAELLESARA